MLILLLVGVLDGAGRDLCCRQYSTYMFNADNVLLRIFKKMIIILWLVIDQCNLDN